MQIYNKHTVSFSADYFGTYIAILVFTFGDLVTEDGFLYVKQQRVTFPHDNNSKKTEEVIRREL